MRMRLRTSGGWRNAAAFTLAEVIIAVGIVAIGFLGAFAMVLQSGRMVSAADEDALVCSALEQRMDQLRELDWTSLTNGTGLTGTVWAARPLSTSGLTISESMSITGFDLTNGQTLTGTWTSSGSPSATLSGATPALSTASAIKIAATISWTGRRSSSSQTRTLVTVISRGGISKSDLP